MNIALASETDVNCALALCGQINDLLNENFPRVVDKDGETEFPQDDEQYFDFENDEHCATALRRLFDNPLFSNSGHNRVIFGFHTFLFNNIHNPEPTDGCLNIHPDFAEIMALREKGITGLRIIPMLQTMEWNGHAIHPNTQFATACPCCHGINPSHPNADYFEKTDHGHKPECLLHRIITAFDKST